MVKWEMVKALQIPSERVVEVSYKQMTDGVCPCCGGTGKTMVETGEWKTERIRYDQWERDGGELLREGKNDK
jgi:hypothetical protein